ncbi:MAG TPA: MBOAT family protein [Deltaproteobacteria bacterium]|nr:MBOAT family protein [Deltaproteobacteria bacterium]
MSFVQIEFVWLFLAVFVLYWMLPGGRTQNIVLLCASVVFYGWITPLWVLLLYASATIDFVMAQLMVRSPRHRRVWLGASLTSNLGLLFWFKYFDFFVVNVHDALASLGLETSLHALGIVLPAGISFYTFQTMSYTIDVYRGELRPRRSYLDYLVFVSFFPQLVAGPIERAGRLLPQLEQRRVLSWSAVESGLGLALWGGFKKLVIADTLAPYVDKVFLLKDTGGPLIWAATAAFMVQIYADFSGYTDIARGTAKMLGIHLVRNFDEPYRATTTPEFWQRWHMSLSTWIRDYLLAPLLGDADAIRPIRFAVAITVTMVVMGVWHGAGWNFVLFGLFQAACILGYALALRNLPEAARRVPGGRTLAAAFHLTFVGGIGALMFREPSVYRIWMHLSSNPLDATPHQWRAVVTILSLLFVLNTPLVIEHFAKRTVIPRWKRTPWWLPLQTTVWSVYVVLMSISYRTTSMDFIYFQF